MTDTAAETRTPQDQPEASLIMLSFNTAPLLRQSLARLIEVAREIKAEVIVVDNASHDGSAALVEAEFPDVQLVRAPHNLGFAGGNNLGARHASGEFLVLVNSDAFIQPGRGLPCCSVFL